MKNILITGSGGFIGKNLIKNIQKKKADSNNNIILLSSEPIKGYTCIKHDNYSFVKETFFANKIENIDIVIHLGAFTPKNSNERNNIKSSLANISNTYHLCNNLPSMPKKFIFASTIDVYEETTDIINETSKTEPTTLYGFSKLFCEKLLEVWAKENNVLLQILRIGHIYGEGEDDYQKILPMTLQKILRGDPPIIFTDGKEKRSLLNVQDCCHLILKSLELEDYPGPINLVSMNSISILELVETIIRISNAQIKPIIQNNPVKTRDYVFDNSKMRKYLGTETVPLETGLESEYEYLKQKQAEA